MSFRRWSDLIDAPGVLLFTVGLVALLVGLLSAKSSGQISFNNVIVGLIGFVGLGAFVRHELKAKAPFIPLRTFAKYPAMTWVNVEFMIVNLLFTLSFRASVLLANRTSCQRIPYRDAHAKLRLVLARCFSNGRTMDR